MASGISRVRDLLSILQVFDPHVGHICPMVAGGLDVALGAHLSAGA